MKFLKTSALLKMNDGSHQWRHVILNIQQIELFTFMLLEDGERAGILIECTNSRETHKYNLENYSKITDYWVRALKGEKIEDPDLFYAETIEV